jgi:xylulose-5-phosphate/fructose-6-phosphate phosphoketolase
MEAENVPPLGNFLRDVMKLNMTNFRVLAPDENTSNKLHAVYQAAKKFWIAEYFPEDQDGGELSPDGRVIEMLSEHTMQGMLEGYLLTGRNGFFSTYEAFVHVVDSMFNQHAKWLSICSELSWRRPISSLNLLITSTVWRQDHNGFTHQDPGFLDVVLNKSAAVTRIYLPPDVNCLLSVADHCLSSENTSTSSFQTSNCTSSIWTCGGDRALHEGYRHVGVGVQRPGMRARPGDGVGGRHPDSGSIGGDRPAAR